jgi:hypothetical protein
MFDLVANLCYRVEAMGGVELTSILALAQDVTDAVCCDACLCRRRRTVTSDRECSGHGGNFERSVRGVYPALTRE